MCFCIHLFVRYVCQASANRITFPLYPLNYVWYLQTVCITIMFIYTTARATGDTSTTPTHSSTLAPEFMFLWKKNRELHQFGLVFHRRAILLTSGKKGEAMNFWLLLFISFLECICFHIHICFSLRSPRQSHRYEMVYYAWRTGNST